MILGDWFWDLPSCLHGGVLHLVSSVSTFWGCAEKSEEIGCFMTPWLEPRQQATVSLEDDLKTAAPCFQRDLRVTAGSNWSWQLCVSNEANDIFSLSLPAVKELQGSVFGPIYSLVFSIWRPRCVARSSWLPFCSIPRFFFRDIRNQHLMRFGSIKSGCNYSVLFSVVF